MPWIEGRGRSKHLLNLATLTALVDNDFAATQYGVRDLLIHYQVLHGEVTCAASTCHGQLERPIGWLIIKLDERPKSLDKGASETPT